MTPTRTPYTQFPNIAVSWLMPILEPPEWVCLSYIIRRTYGFVGSDGERKKSDVISLEQFEKGITRSDGAAMDLGTGLAKSTIRNALEGLEQKQIINSRFACTRCGWAQGEDVPDPKPHGRAKSPSCPNCKRSLSRAYGLAALSARRLEEILNQYDPKGRAFTWSRERMTYLVEVPEDAKRRHQEEEADEEEAVRLRNLLWFPALVDEAVKQAEGALKAGGSMRTSRKIRSFYRPVLALQEEFVSAPLIQYALEQTIERKIAFGKKADTWHRYARAICEKNKTVRRFAGAPVAHGINAELQAAQSPEARERALRDLLSRAADLNGRGEYDAARQLLSDLLADENVRGVAPLFGGDVALAEASLREAYKQGISDFVGVDPADSLGLDFLASWSWPDDLQTPRQRRLAAETAAASA